MKEMKIIGLTGGIGSGKTTLAYWFAVKNIPVYTQPRLVFSRRN